MQELIGNKRNPWKKQKKNASEGFPLAGCFIHRQNPVHPLQLPGGIQKIVKKLFKKDHQDLIIFPTFSILCTKKE